MRHASGRLAVEACDRLRELMAAGFEIQWSGETGYYGRELVTITLRRRPGCQRGADVRGVGPTVAESGKYLVQVNGDRAPEPQRKTIHEETIRPSPPLSSRP